MIRLLADPPAAFNVAQIAAPGLVSCNIVNTDDGEKIAGYWVGDAPTEAEWQAVVDAHVPADPDPDPVAVLQAQVAELQAVIDALLGGD